MKNNNNTLKSYKKIAKWFIENRSQELFEKKWLDKAIANLERNDNKILDLGCGTGEPIAKYFLDNNFDVTGVDGCEEFIKLAKEKLKQGTFLHQDMRDLNLNKKFNLIISWHSFFHLTVNEQTAMFDTFKKHLQPNGILLFTTGDIEGEVYSNNGGENLYHASMSIEQYKGILENNKFKIIDYKIKDSECCDSSIWLSKYCP